MKQRYVSLNKTKFLKCCSSEFIIIIVYVWVFKYKFWAFENAVHLKGVYFFICSFVLMYWRVGFWWLKSKSGILFVWLFPFWKTPIYLLVRTILFAPFIRNFTGHSIRLLIYPSFILLRSSSFHPYKFIKQCKGFFHSFLAKKQYLRKRVGKRYYTIRSQWEQMVLYGFTPLNVHCSIIIHSN